MTELIGSKPKQPEKPKQKPDDIKIIHTHSTLMPNNMTGGMGLVIFGLGDNSEIYVWDAGNRVWLEH